MKPILKGPILYHKYVVYLPVLLTAFFYLNSTWMHQTHKFLKAVGEHTLLLHTTWLLTAAQLAFRAVKCEIILNSHPLPELLVVLLLQLPVRTASLQPKSPLLQSTASQTKCNSQRACAYAFQCKIKALPRPCPHSISLAPRGVAHAVQAQPPVALSFTNCRLFWFPLLFRIWMCWLQVPWTGKAQDWRET